MYTVTYYWLDGSRDEFVVDNKAHAEAMRDRLYQNSEIVSVEIEEPM